MFTLPSVPERVRAAYTFKANTPCLKRKVKCQRRGRSSNTSSLHEQRALQSSDSTEGGRPWARRASQICLQLGRHSQWVWTWSSFNNWSVFALFLVCVCCISAALLSASEIDLCIHVCCYGEISLALCIVFQDLGFGLGIMHRTA